MSHASAELQLPPSQEKVLGWGMSVGGKAQVLRPNSIEQIQQALAFAKTNQLKVALRGAGCSYGDASCGNGKLVVDLSLYNRILHFSKDSGVIRVQAGARIRDIWHLTVSQGWWPPVVSGTMEPTLGGALAMNIHGKNAYCVGPIGEHVRGIKVLTVAGELRELTPEGDSELFHAIIGGFGELAVIVEVELQLKHVYSGLLQVHSLVGDKLSQLFEIFEQWQHRSDYLVGWVDGFASGEQTGRGQVHVAHQLKPGDDPQPDQTLALKNQELPSRLFGVIPKSWMWLFLRPVAHNFGMRLLNIAKYYSAKLLAHDKFYRQSHAAFHFLLDYVPNWKFIYKPSGLIQHQCFVPKDKALQVFIQILQLEQQRGMPTWLAVLKRHRADNFLLTHGLDGYSLAQDFKVTAANRAKLWAMCHDIDQIVTAAGGRFYFAKDATLRPESFVAAMPLENIQKFAELRHALDPDGLLATDLYDRTVAPALRAVQ